MGRMVECVLYDRQGHWLANKEVKVDVDLGAKRPRQEFIRIPEVPRRPIGRSPLSTIVTIRDFRFTTMLANGHLAVYSEVT